MDKTRVHWVDNVKVIACVLVAVGHFWQSMVASGILQGSGFYSWFNQTIYYFHVPLFFVCSGYLYQRYNRIDTVSAWGKNAGKKLISLGIPYFTFSTVTWVLKTVFSNSVNTEVNSLAYDLFVHPLSPYWYLYALFFIFLIVPTFSDKRRYFLCVVATVLLKLTFRTEIYVLSIVTDNIVWFMLGMGICLLPSETLPKKIQTLGPLLLSMFLVSSIVVWYFSWTNEILRFALGLFACSSVVMLTVHFGGKPIRMARYTMAIYLMHTIFAAGIRSVLFKLGVTAAVIHVPVGLMASFLGPILAAEIMKKTKLDFFLEPGKYIRIT